MERKIWIGLIVSIGMVLSAISGPAFGSQLAIDANDPMLYGRSITNQWAGKIMAPHFGFDPSSEIFTWESQKMGTQKMGTGIIPNVKIRSQWDDISFNEVSFSSDTAAQEIFGSHSTIWAHHWAAEEIFSNNSFFSSKDSKTEEETDTSELPPLPNALWLCGFGIMGILCVRRTNDDSNVS